MEKSLKTLFLTAADIFAGLAPDKGPIIQVVKAGFEQYTEKDKVSQLSRPGKELISALDMVQKIENSSSEVKTDVINIKFNRALNEDEQRRFMDEKAIQEAYSYCSIDMERFERDDNWTGIDVYFSKEVSESEIAKFSTFIDQYIKKTGKDLYVKAVYV